MTVNHYDATKWVDFVRGVIVGREREAMQAHLGTACTRCGRITRLLGATAEAAASDSRWDVPDSVVQTARLFFALQRPEKVRILPRMVATLMYDSFRDPLPAGVRAQHHLSRQALYEAGRYSVDVRLEHERGSARINLVGQIADREQPTANLGDVPVLLMSGKAVVARALSNRFGEFQMEYEPARRVWLDVPVEQRGQGGEVDAR
jgi:hypothetical protein